MPSKLKKFLIVDDEPPARKRMRALLEVARKGAAVFDVGSLEDARNVLLTESIDTIFLDIHMPPENGFDLLKSIPAETAVVFVTAFDTYAIRAFEVNAVDYLLKPVEMDRLNVSLARLNDQEGPPRSIESHSDIVIFRDGQSWQSLHANEIIFIRADGTYSVVMASNGRQYMIIRPLRKWMTALPHRQFARLSRSLIINLMRIESFSVSGRDEGWLWLEDMVEPIQLRRTAISNLRKYLPLAPSKSLTL